MTLHIIGNPTEVQASMPHTISEGVARRLPSSGDKGPRIGRPRAPGGGGHGASDLLCRTLPCQHG